MPPALHVRAYSHLLAPSGLCVFGTAEILADLPPEFPARLDGAAVLLPGEGVAVRPGLLHWIGTKCLRPRVIGEFDDSALLKSFGQAGAGLFAAPAADAAYLCRQYGVRVASHIPELVLQVHATTTERRFSHPGVVAVVTAARPWGGHRPLPLREALVPWCGYAPRVAAHQRDEVVGRGQGAAFTFCQDALGQSALVVVE